MMRKWIVEILVEDKEGFFPIPDEILEHLGLEVDDDVLLSYPEGEALLVVTPVKQAEHGRGAED